MGIAVNLAAAGLPPGGVQRAPTDSRRSIAPGALLPPRGALLFHCSLSVLALLEPHTARCSVNACSSPFATSSVERGRRPLRGVLRVVNRKEELTAMIDRDWPHQIALPTYRRLGHNYVTIHPFCDAERLSLCRRGHSLRRDDIEMNVFCFAERTHAEQFPGRLRR